MKIGRIGKNAIIKISLEVVLWIAFVIIVFIGIWFLFKKIGF